MREFDVGGGPWGYRLQRASGAYGIDVYLDAGYVTNAPVTFEGRMNDRALYVGRMDNGATLLMRANWFNQGAHYRATVANYPDYPSVACVHAAALTNLNAYLPELVIQNGGVIDLAPLLPLLSSPAITSDNLAHWSLLALLSAAAAGPAQRDTLATALALTADQRATLLAHGVLVLDHVGAFNATDHAEIRAMLSFLPDPVKRQLHLIVRDESIPAGTFGGYNAGGIINVKWIGNGLASFRSYPSGRTLPQVSGWQAVLMHEIGHLCDANSVLYEDDRWKTIWASGVGDPDAQLYKSILPPTVDTEDIIFYFLGYCTDSATILAEVAERGNPVLSQKLAHVIDMLPSVVPGTVPFFTTDPSTHVTTMSLVGATRGPSAYLGDDGMITSVNGVTLP